MPRVLRKRIVVVDHKRRSLDRLYALLEPLSEEMKVELHKGREGAVGIGVKKDLKNQVLDENERSLLNLWLRGYPFLVALDNHLQVELPLELLKLSLIRLDRVFISPEARAHLAIMAGIFNTYERQELGSILYKSLDSTDLVSLFDDFLEDVTFRAMCKASHDLGFPLKMKNSVIRIRSLANELVSKPPFKHILVLGSKIATAAASLPDIEDSISALLLQKGYLPPLISLRNVLDQASMKYKESDLSKWSEADELRYAFLMDRLRRQFGLHS